MNDERKLGFFKLYFKNFKAMLLTNLFFAVPFILATALVYFAASLLHQTSNLWFMGTAIIIIYPFFSGVTQVTKEIVKTGDSNFKVFQTYKKGLKNNFLYFALYGVIIYAAAVISYYSIVTYYKMAAQSWLFYIPLFITILIALAILFISFSLPILTVTLELKLRYYFKNAALMAIGELPMNFYVMITTAALISGCLSVPVMTGNLVVGLIVLGVALFLILPTGISYCSMYRLYPKLEDIFDIKDEENDKTFPIMPVAVPTDENGEPIKGDSASDGEYVFAGGKMIKKSQAQAVEYIDESD